MPGPPAVTANLPIYRQSVHVCVCCMHCRWLVCRIQSCPTRETDGRTDCDPRGAGRHATEYISLSCGITRLSFTSDKRCRSKQSHF